MNVSFTAPEMLRIYETLIKDVNADKHLIDKFRVPILTILEREQEKLEQEMYVAWAAQEAQKINDLSQKNAELVPVVSVPPKVDVVTKK